MVSENKAQKALPSCVELNHWMLFPSDSSQDPGHGGELGFLAYEIRYRSPDVLYFNSSQ